MTTKLLITAVAVALAVCATSSTYAVEPKAAIAASKQLKIQSESQFLRDYAGSIERVADGVYLVVSGPHVGKTISIGDAGLEYDLNTLRSRMQASARTTTQQQELLSKLEALSARNDKRPSLDQKLDTRALIGGGLVCYVWSSKGNLAVLFGSAVVEADADYFPWSTLRYYAYANAQTYGFINNFPYQPNLGISIGTSAFAEDALTGEQSYDFAFGVDSASASAAVYSGPSFGHSVSSYATVYGTGQCYGYVGISAAYSL